MPLLAWATTGDAGQIDAVKSFIQPAQVKEYARFTLRGKGYPAVIKQDGDESAVVDGLLFYPRNHSQRKKLDDFEGETYKVTAVDVQIIGPNGVVEEWINADMYAWSGDLEAVSTEGWDLEKSIRERLDDW